MESVLPDPEQLLLFLRKLKEVFDVCDEDSDGFIRVEHFVDLGSQFGQGDEVIHIPIKHHLVFYGVRYSSVCLYVLKALFLCFLLCFMSCRLCYYTFIDIYLQIHLCLDI